MLLIIDNYDSFTYNLVQRIGEHDLIKGITREIKVIRNDDLTKEEVISLKPEYLIISPGPCTPNESGISKSLIKYYAGRIPILGVCLGHQTIASVFGIPIIKYEKPVNGKTSKVFHNNSGIFKNIQNPMDATRYHSLIIDISDNNPLFKVIAWTDDGICMGIQWTGNGEPMYGVQFHPESFLTPDGPKIIENFLS